MNWLKKIIPLLLVDLLKKKTDYGVKNKDIENKTPSITGLATIAALTAVKIKIPKVSDLVSKSG